MLSTKQGLARVSAQRGWSWALAAVAGLSFAGALAGMTYAGNFTSISQYFLVIQDAPILLVLGVFLAVVGLLSRMDVAIPAPGWIERCCQFRFVVVLAIVVSLGVYAGAHLIQQNFALTADEIMAEFDARIIATGRLLAPVAPEWRDYVPALQPSFHLAIPENDYWISSYLPMNAALRAVFVLLGDPAWEGAFLAGVAIIALFGVARRLWPDRPDAALISVILLVCSSQFLLMAMTPYAMTAHLALNMIWLWLFLRDRPGSHVMAAGVAFVACGLHQIVFHPLFAAPFILSLFVARRWKLAACYSFVYASIGLFWIFYWSFLLHAANAQVAQAADVGIAYFFRRIADMAKLSTESFVSMGLSLWRFLAWQNPLTVPLACIGALAWRGRNIASLAAGIALTLGVMLVLMASQGHGWGYRYLHGLLGSFSLIAAQGWVSLTDRGVAAANKPALALLSSVLLSWLVLVPARALQVRTFVEPYAAAVETIARADADIVVVDSAEIWYGADLVRNDPFLRTSPKAMALIYLDEAQLVRLCRHYDVAIFDRDDAVRLGLDTEQSLPQIASHNQGLRDVMKSLQCGRPIAGDRSGGIGR